MAGDQFNSDTIYRIALDYDAVVKGSEITISTIQKLDKEINAAIARIEANLSRGAKDTELLLLGNSESYIKLRETVKKEYDLIIADLRKFNSEQSVLIDKEIANRLSRVEKETISLRSLYQKQILDADKLRNENDALRLASAERMAAKYNAVMAKEFVKQPYNLQGMVNYEQNIAGMDKLKVATTQAGISFQSFTRYAEHWAIRMGMFWAAFKIIEFINSATFGFLKLNRELVKSAEISNMTTQEFQKLAYAGQMNLISTDKLTRYLDAQGKAIKDLSEGTGDAAKAFSILKITYEQLEGKSPYEQLLLVADAFTKITNQEDRNFVATALYQKQGREMIAMFKDGANGIRAYGAELEEMGVLMTEEYMETSKQAAISLERLKKNFEALQIYLGTSFVPFLNNTLIPTMQGWIEIFRGLELAQSRAAQSASSFLEQEVRATKKVTEGAEKYLKVYDELIKKEKANVTAFAAGGSYTTNELKASKDKLAIYEQERISLLAMIKLRGTDLSEKEKVSKKSWELTDEEVKKQQELVTLAKLRSELARDNNEIYKKQLDQTIAFLEPHKNEALVLKELLQLKIEHNLIDGKNSDIIKKSEKDNRDYSESIGDICDEFEDLISVQQRAALVMDNWKKGVEDGINSWKSKYQPWSQGQATRMNAGLFTQEQGDYIEEEFDPSKSNQIVKFSSAWKEAQSKFKEGWSDAIESTKKSFGTLESASNSIGLSVGQSFLKMFDTIENALSDSIYSMLAESVKFKDAMCKLWDDLKNSAIRALSDITANAIMGFAKIAIFSEGGSTSKGPGSLPHFARGGLASGGSLPKIPHAAQGMYTGNGSGAIPIIAHPREWIIPNNYIKNFFGTMAERLFSGQGTSSHSVTNTHSYTPNINVHIYSPDLNDPVTLKMIGRKIGNAIQLDMRGRVKA